MVFMALHHFFIILKKKQLVLIFYLHLLTLPLHVILSFSKIGL